MKNNFKVFYSWQSDLKAGNKVIAAAIDKSIKEIKRQKHKDLTLEINLDRDTRGNSGSPAITKTIFEKIERSDIFICDVSIINNSWLNRRLGIRLTPNPNVLIELGYAIHVLGWERVICISDLDIADLESLPFDIRGHRITALNSKDVLAKEKLTDTLVLALKSIIGKFDEIIEGQNRNSYKSYDLGILAELNTIGPEGQFRDSISVITVSLYTNKTYLKIYDKWNEFYGLSQNRFIDKELNDLFEEVLKHYKKFYYETIRNFHFYDTQNETYQKFLSLRISGYELSEDEQFEYEQSQVFTPHKDPFPGESWHKSDERIYKLQDMMNELGNLTIKAYEDFIAKCKQKLL